MRQSLGRRIVALGAVGSLAFALAACSSGNSAPASTATVSEKQIQAALNKETTLVYWGGTTTTPELMKQFEKLHPKIHIKVESPGSSAAGLSQTLQTAEKAGTGVPDMVEFGNAGELAAFVLTKDVVNFDRYGAEKFGKDYVSGAWKFASFANGVWGLPLGTGPTALIYRKDIFQKAGITSLPKTWKEFAADAKTIKETTGSYIADFGLTDALSLVAQGSAPIYNWKGGQDFTINIANPDVKRFADYWTDLIQKGYVATDSQFTDPWYQGMATGKYASWVSPAWGPQFLQGTAAATSGLWRASTLPQWDASKPSYYSGGGSVIAVTAASKHQLAAYALARWITHDPDAVDTVSNTLGIFPALKDQLDNPAIIDQPSAFFGGQKINQEFAAAAKNMSFSGSNPVAAYSLISLQNTVIKSVANKTSLYEGYLAWQSDIASNAKSQGFKVTVTKH
jgi:multiple sugar transport system substrate-binding protein